MTPKTVIITDLDGTLLHPRTYSFEEARPALSLIKQRGIPLVLCSSKTKSEMEVYRERFGNSAPFISENGGGIFIPEGYFPFPVTGETKDGYRVIALGRPYNEIRQVLRNLREQFRMNIRGFGDMSVQEIAGLTGLPLSESEFAKERGFDEPFIFEEAGEGRDVFLKAIQDAGYRWTRGKFYHILGDNDKGKAVQILKGLYERSFGAVKTIGIGDNLNDLSLLKVVDCPVIVRKEDGSYEPGISLPGLIRADGVGPEGWNRAVMRLLSS